MLHCLLEDPVACASAVEAWLGEQWWVTLLLAVLGLWRWAVGGMLSKPGSRERLAGLLRHDSYARAYRGALEWALDRLDAWLTPPQALALPPADWRRAWTVTLYDRCLLLAVVYPTLILLVFWAWTGREGKIGAILLTQSDAPAWLRIVAIGGLIAAVGLFRASVTQKLRRRLTIPFATVLALSSGIAIGSASSGGSGAAFGITIGVGAAFAVLGTFSTAGVFVVAYAVSAAAFFAGTSAVAGPFTAAIAVPIAMAAPLAISRLSVRRVSLRLSYSLLTLFLVLELLIAALWRHEMIDEYSVSIFVFAGVLPLVNAVFDFASIGLTRWALRHGLEWPGPRIWAWATLDLAAAAALFVLLKITAVLAVAGLNAAAGGGPGSGLLDLGDLFAGIRESPQDYWWLYLSFLTTLIPTLLHGVVAVFSLGVWLPRKLHLRWARLIPEAENDWGHRQEVYWGLSLWLTVATAVPVLLLWWAWAGLRAAHADLGGGLLWVAEAVARAVGALP